MIPTAIYELKEDGLHLLPGSDLPQPLRGKLEAKPIKRTSNWYVMQCALQDKKMHVELDNHDQVPGAKEAAYVHAWFEPCHDGDGNVSGVRARYER